MSQPRNDNNNNSNSCNNNNNSNNSRTSKNNSQKSTVTRSTQTEPNITPGQRDEYELKITNYTCRASDSQFSAETVLSRDCSHHLRPRPKKRRGPKDPDMEVVKAQFAADYESSSDSDGLEQRAVPSYDFLEGEKIVTSLVDLRLSDSDDEHNTQPEHVIEEYSNEDKLPKFL